jgi:Pyruvate/2-oxoacid:ferredoxin oxidoreductase delta subunit
VLFLVAAFGAGSVLPKMMFWFANGTLLGGSLIFFGRYARRRAGIQNDGIAFGQLTARGAFGWILGVVFTGFYVVLYWFPQALEHLVRMFDSLSHVLRGRTADQWFLYSFFYTFAVIVMGVRAILRYRHVRYQIVRTISVVFFQLGFAFLIPQLMQLLNEPELYFSYFWPLDYDLLWPSTVSDLFSSSGRLGAFMVIWGAILTFVATPVLTYFFGKRWYCSWVCGCGGLAETLGDPFRQLSDKSLTAWRVERWMVHGVLAFVVLSTAMLWLNAAFGGAILGRLSGSLSRTYGFAIGAVFSGVIGVGFYPLMGSRVWCRFGCPMAAILGLLQKYFSRFRITTNGGQCISCGNCSKYCEMGIDVRWYAQRGQNIIRASCVGCGVCSAVCPRGVLKLENASTTDRYNGPVLIDRDQVSVITDEWPI